MRQILATAFIALFGLIASGSDWILPEGFKVEEYAREPRVIDPVAMDWDAHGRLWVLEAGGRIKIIDREVKVFAEGLAGATSLAIRSNQIFVAHAPQLLVLQGTNREVLIDNLPQPGPRGNMSSLRVGPDGWLYFTQGAQDEAEFYRFGTRAGNPQLISSGVARFHPETKRLEMVADGMVLPRGLAFNEAGDLFAADATPNHLFQIFHGVSYQRPLTRDYMGYKAGALGAIADHRFLPGEFFGMTIYRGMVLVPNLRAKSLHVEYLERRGATHRVRCGEHFLQHTGGEFQPIDIREGPDGALWILDRAGTDARNPFKATGKGRVWRVIPDEKWNGKPQTNDLIMALRDIRDNPPRGSASTHTVALLRQAASSTNVVVRREAATACRALMLGTAAPGIPEPRSVANMELTNAVRSLLDASVRDADAAMEAALWSAVEPLLAEDATAALGMFTTLEAPDAPSACNLFRHSIRRVFGAGYEDHVPAIYPLLAELANRSVPLCLAGLEGTIYGQKSSKRYHRFDKSFRKLVNALKDTGQPELVVGGLQAGALCGYADSRAELLKRMLDSDLDESARLQAVQFAQVLRDEPARQALLQLLENQSIPNLTLAAAYSLREIGRAADVDAVLRAASRQKGEVQLALGQTISERRDWMANIDQQVRAQRLDPTVLPSSVRDKLR